MAGRKKPAAVARVPSGSAGTDAAAASEIERLQKTIERVGELCSSPQKRAELRRVIDESQRTLAIKQDWNRDLTRPLDDFQKSWGLPPIDQWCFNDWRQVAIALAQRLQEATAPRKPGRRPRPGLPRVGLGEQTEEQIAALSFWADELIAETVANRAEAKRHGRPPREKLTRGEAIRQVVLASIKRDNKFAATDEGRKAGVPIVGEHRLTKTALDTLVRRESALRRKNRTKSPR